MLVPRRWVPACAQHEGAGSPPAVDAAAPELQGRAGCSSQGSQRVFACGWTLLSVLPQLLRAGLCSP